MAPKYSIGVQWCWDVVVTACSIIFIIMKSFSVPFCIVTESSWKTLSNPIFTFLPVLSSPPSLSLSSPVSNRVTSLTLFLSIADNYHAMNTLEQKDRLEDGRMDRWFVKWLEKGGEKRKGVYGVTASILPAGSWPMPWKFSLSLRVFPIAVFLAFFLSLLVLQRYSRKNKHINKHFQGYAKIILLTF